MTMGTTGFAKQLRRNQTDAERVLWFRLRNRRLQGLKFKRQAPIDRYIVDFCCFDARLIIELDGGQHATRAVEDMNRTRILEAMGYLVLRFWNNDVLQNLEGVLERFWPRLNNIDPTPLIPPSPPWGEGVKGSASLNAT